MVAKKTQKKQMRQEKLKGKSKSKTNNKKVTPGGIKKEISVVLSKLLKCQQSHCQKELNDLVKQRKLAEKRCQGKKNSLEKIICKANYSLKNKTYLSLKKKKDKCVEKHCRKFSQKSKELIKAVLLQGLKKEERKKRKKEI